MPDDVPLAVREGHIVQLDVEASGALDARPLAHLWGRDQVVDLVHADVYLTQETRIGPGKLELRVDHERSDYHQQAGARLHGLTDPAEDSEQAEGNRGELSHERLDDHVADEVQLHRQVHTLTFVDGPREPALGAVHEVEGAHDGDTLHVLEDRPHDGALCGNTMARDGMGAVLHEGVDGEHTDDGRNDDKTAAPVHHAEHDGDDGGEDQARDDVGVHEASDVLHVIEGVGHGARYLAQAVLVEVAHGQVAHVVTDARALLGGHGEVAVTEACTPEVGRHEGSRNGDKHDNQGGKRRLAHVRISGGACACVRGERREHDGQRHHLP